MMRILFYLHKSEANAWHLPSSKYEFCVLLKFEFMLFLRGLPRPRFNFHNFAEINHRKHSKFIIHTHRVDFVLKVTIHTQKIQSQSTPKQKINARKF